MHKKKKKKNYGEAHKRKKFMKYMAATTTSENYRISRKISYKEKNDNKKLQ